VSALLLRTKVILKSNLIQFYVCVVEGYKSIPQILNHPGLAAGDFESRPFQYFFFLSFLSLPADLKVLLTQFYNLEQ